MPTGYTSAVVNGASFKQYLQGCARAFIIQLRDDPLDAPLPRSLPPDTYHEDELARATAERARLMSLSAAELDAEAKADYVKCLAWWETRQKENAEQIAKYQAMLDQVLAWELPTPEHRALKEFMASQLRQSIAHDMHDPKYDPKPAPKTGAFYLEEKLAAVDHDIEHHGQRVQQKNEGYANINAWLEAIHVSMEKLP